jgi:hypothetical protein
MWRWEYTYWGWEVCPRVFPILAWCLPVREFPHCTALTYIGLPHSLTTFLSFFVLLTA